jgi:hypothetical protein
VGPAITLSKVGYSRPGDELLSPYVKHRKYSDIRANCAVSKNHDRTAGNIDEKGSLPYKPRQLSAMTRFDRGGSIWAGKWPALGLPASSDISHLSGRLPGQRRTTREADLPTQQTGAQAPPWLPRPIGHDRWPQGPRRSPRAWPQTSERLSRASRRDLSWIG